MVFFFSASKTLSLPTPAFLTRTTRHHPHVTQSASSQSNASSSNDSTILRVATKGFTPRDDNEDVLEDHHRTSTNATATTTTTGRRRSRRSAALTMMSPIQLQDVARKQFEDRERRRAQQVRRRSHRKRNPTQHFFSKVFSSSPVVKKERVFIGGSFLRIIILRLYFDAADYAQTSLIISFSAQQFVSMLSHY